MQITESGLKRPEIQEINIESFGENVTILDEHLRNTDIHVNAGKIAEITEPDELAQIDSTDTNSTMWGKIKKSISEVNNHVDKVASDTKLGHIKIGTGLQVSEDGKAKVKIANNLETDDSETALSAAMGLELSKELYDTLNPTEFKECVNFTSIVGTNNNITSTNGILYPDIEDKAITITAGEVLGVMDLTTEQLGKLTTRKYDRGFIITSYDETLSKKLANRSVLLKILVN
ncbi:hypothetical protein [Lachnotalea glycerini]|uniref:Uncharacterized protein n=1 Tax=Lachnotalea glycerini TaxID=1763509 RepID=A0A371JBL0_9FIRM|nr:hypothetical protein [Lachnotalea glycerini]RDY30151.1 hypothetical protein CG710_016050 [Lachnotalea glycerini]